MSSSETEKPSQKPRTNASLPDDLLLNCFARVSRLYYPTLSLVSKRFRSLIASPELYKDRSLLGHTERCLYVCLRFSDRRPRWFTFCRKPNRTLTDDTNEKKKSSGYALARVPIPHSPAGPCFSRIVAVGSDIYNIDVHSSSVSVLDCKSHTWREGPSLPVKLVSLSSSVVDRKIFVAGVREDGENSFEVLDTRTQSWDPEPVLPCRETNRKKFGYTRSASIDGKFHVTTSAYVVAYDPKESRWERVKGAMSTCMFQDSYCEIENVLYSCVGNNILWYDTMVGMWREMRGLEELHRIRSAGYVRSADYGGKMAVLWERELLNSRPRGGYKKKIWCAEIALERRGSHEIWGKVEWFDDVLYSYSP